MGLSPVVDGVDVVAAGEDQPVEQVEHRVGVVFEARVRRDHHRHPAGALDRLDVGEREERGLALLPHAPVGAGERGADADGRPRLAHRLLSLARWIFPDAVLGSSSAKSTIRGYLYGAVWCLTCSWSSAASA